MRVGLHNHTCFSDGRYSPTALVAQAQALGYERFALTDHNSVAGWQSLEVLPAWVVPGIELSALADDGSEVHLLGLGVRPRGELQAHCQFFQAAYDELWRTGIAQVSDDAALSTLAADPRTRHRAIEQLCQGSGTPQALRGWALAHGEAYLNKLRPRIPHWRRAITWLRESEATVGLAHPGRYPHLLEIDELLRAVDAVEVIHPDHSAESQLFWRAAAQSRAKACWGSHDFHGWSGYQRNGLPQPVELDPNWISSSARWCA